MPIYEYRCPSCHKKFELLRPASRSGEDAPCPTCHSSGRRILSTFCAATKTEDGFTMPAAGGGGGCGSCGSSNCGSCGL